MDWDKLRIFHSVAEAGSFTHAGEILNLSQSAVSRQISALEDSLGVPLFHRHARGLLLTEQGELLQKTAKDIFARLAMVQGKIHDTKQLPEGPLRITTAAFIGSTWLAPRLKEFQANYPDIHLTLLLDNRIFDLGMREADAAIRLYKPEHPDLVQRLLSTINFHIYGSKNYLEQHGQPKTLSDLNDHTLIGYPESEPAPFPDQNWLFRTSGVHMNDNPRILMMNSMYAIQRSVEADCGLSILPDYLAQNNENLKMVLPDVSPPSVDVYFVYPEERRNSQRIAIFRDFLLKIVSQTEF